ncbi:MAG: hypothetical protein ACLQO6_07260 [Desulfomonilaceae bacterium]
MNYLIILIVALTVFLNGCSSLMDAHFVTKDGKESPFSPKINKYEPIQQPSYRD